MMATNREETPPKLFGTDGIRGPVGTLPITAENILRLGHVVGRVLRENFHTGRPAVLIGKDTRLSGYMMESALEAGLLSAGVDVHLAGPVPTAAVAYLTRTLRLQAGVVISASHNPYSDNGVKFFSDNGNKLSDAMEAQIELYMVHPPAYVAAQDMGRAQRIEGASSRYIEFCKSTFADHLRGLKLVVDSAHGAAYHVARDVFHELGAEVICLGNHPNGFNINQHVGATHPQAMAHAVVEHQAHCGIALDGDGDRLIMADDQGRILNGDLLLWILAMDRQERGKLPGVVGTVMTNGAVEDALRRKNIPFVRAKVGDRYVLEELQARKWTLGGESSGHLLCLEYHTTGDGIISALQVLLALKQRHQTLAQFHEQMPLYPQVMINVPLRQEFHWQSHPPLQNLRHEVEESLRGQGRVLLRPSGTEACLRIMVEGRDKQKITDFANRLAAAAQP